MRGATRFRLLPNRRSGIANRSFTVLMDSSKGCPDNVASPHIFTQLGANRVERAASKTYLPRRKITV